MLKEGHSNFVTTKDDGVNGDSSPEAWSEPLVKSGDASFSPQELSSIERSLESRLLEVINLHFGLDDVEGKIDCPHAHADKGSGLKSVPKRDLVSSSVRSDGDLLVLKKFVQLEIKCESPSVSDQSGGLSSEDSLDTVLLEDLSGCIEHGVIFSGLSSSLDLHSDTDMFDRSCNK